MGIRLVDENDNSNTNNLAQSSFDGCRAAVHGHKVCRTYLHHDDQGGARATSEAQISSCSTDVSVTTLFCMLNYIIAAKQEPRHPWHPRFSARQVSAPSIREISWFHI